MINVPHVHACVIGVDQSCQARGRQTYVRTGHILGAGKEGKGQEKQQRVVVDLKYSLHVRCTWALTMKSPLSQCY